MTLKCCQACDYPSDLHYTVIEAAFGQGLQAASGAEDPAIDNQARITQLQQMLRDLQSQQAASSQQLQIQQAALMQSQVPSDMTTLFL